MELRDIMKREDGRFDVCVARNKRYGLYIYHINKSHLIPHDASDFTLSPEEEKSILKALRGYRVCMLLYDRIDCTKC